MSCQYYNFSDEFVWGLGRILRDNVDYMLTAAAVDIDAPNTTIYIVTGCVMYQVRWPVRCGDRALRVALQFAANITRSTFAQ